MFTRSSAAEPKKPEPRTTNSTTTANGSRHRTDIPDCSAKSVIGNDLKIIGQELKIISAGILQVDGEIDGDVQGAEVIVGEKGNVTGMVAGQRVIVRGTVSKTVALQASSKVEGDVHHMSFAIEQGAQFEGRSRRAANETDLNAVVEGKAGGRSGLN